MEIAERRPRSESQPVLDRPNSEFSYQSGFGNEFASEALSGALPIGRNSPQRCPYGLYAEQLSGAAFTAPRSENRRSWLYRIRPAVTHKPFRRIDSSQFVGAFDVPTPPHQLRWNPLPFPEDRKDFVDSIVTMAGNGACGPPVRRDRVDGRPVLL